MGGSYSHDDNVPWLNYHSFPLIQEFLDKHRIQSAAISTHTPDWVHYNINLSHTKKIPLKGSRFKNINKITTNATKELPSEKSTLKIDFANERTGEKATYFAKDEFNIKR